MSMLVVEVAIATTRATVSDQMVATAPTSHIYTKILGIDYQIYPLLSTNATA